LYERIVEGSSPLWYYLFDKNNQEGIKTPTKTMITQNNETIQAIGEIVYNEIPIIQDASGGAIYILMKDLPEKTANYIQGEMGEIEEGMELPVLAEGYEKMVLAGWRSRGFECTNGRQSMEYMKCNVIIRYLHVINPETGASIFLIPWFMLPRKKHPVQVYAYAAWYSTYAGEPASVTEAAEVVKGLFGLETFNPSTVYRTRAQMARLFREHGENDGALSNEEPKTASTEAIIDWVTEELEKQPSNEPIKYTDGIKAAGDDTQPIPTAVKDDDGQTSEIQRSAEKSTGRCDKEGSAALAPGGRAAHRASDDSVIARVLGNIPRALAEVKKPKIRIKYERRRRTPRERGERLPAKHKKIVFIQPGQLKTIRDEFTRGCKNMVLNAALNYHKLLN